MNAICNTQDQEGTSEQQSKSGFKNKKDKCDPEPCDESETSSENEEKEEEEDNEEPENPPTGANALRPLEEITDEKEWRRQIRKNRPKLIKDHDKYLEGIVFQPPENPRERDWHKQGRLVQRWEISLPWFEDRSEKSFVESWLNKFCPVRKKTLSIFLQKAKSRNEWRKEKKRRMKLRTQKRRAEKKSGQVATEVHVKPDAKERKREKNRNKRLRKQERQAEIQFMLKQSEEQTATATATATALHVKSDVGCKFCKKGWRCWLHE